MDGQTVVRLVEFALGVVTVLGLVWVGAPGRWPWAVMARSIGRVVVSWRRALYMAACLSILAVNYLYLVSGLDDRCTARVVEQRGADYAELIHRSIEGDAVARVQGAVACMPLTWALGYVYVVVFPCLIFAALFVFDARADRHGLALVLVGYLLNFAIVFPFYMAVPVRETFVYYQETGLGPPAARLLLDDISPLIMQVYRGMSGVDNCFPSFHTSLSVTMGIVAWHGRRAFGMVMSAFAAAIVASTIYLGVHWITDVVAGVVTGVVAYGLARVAARRWRRKLVRNEG